MLILDATTKSLEAKLSGAPATNQLPIVVSYVDITTTTYVPGESDTVTNSGTAVTALAAPGASTQRQLKSLCMRNRDTASVTPTIQYNNNGTIRELWKGTLAVDDTLFYEEGDGFYVLDSTGGRKGAGTGGGSNHNILSSTHTDSATGTVVRGDLIVGNSTPAWARVAKGSANQAFRMDSGGTDPAWGTLPEGGLSISDVTTGDVSTSAHGFVPKITGSDGYSLQKSGTGAIWAASTSGDSTLTSAYGSRPAASNDGNVFFPSDSFYIERDTGAVYASWGPIFPLTPPVSGDFSWVNQGSATISTTNGGVLMTVDALATSPNMRLRTKAATAPYTVTAMMIPNSSGVSFHHYGIFFRQSSDGKLAVFSMQWTAGVPKLLSAKYTSATAFSAEYTSLSNFDRIMGGNGGRPFLRIADDNSNRICSYSFDGVNFRQFHSVGRTDFLTADHVGFFASTESSVDNLSVLLLSWKQT